jgi:predicted NBD/HSP70 family sugar kinase
MVEQTGGPPLLREINTAAVLTVLRGSIPLRLAEIAARTGLSRPTVGQSVSKLVVDGWAEYVDGATSPGPGRPARRVRFRSETAYVVGIDVGPHKIRTVVADLDGEVVARSQVESHGLRTSGQLLGRARWSVTTALRRARVPRERVASVAVGTPGTVDPSTHVLTSAPSLEGWESLGLGDAVHAWFDCPVQVENDANLAALAESWRGVARGVDTVVYVHWGARIGAGVLIGGRLHRGVAGAAGEIGYLAVTGGARDARPDARGLGPFERAVNAAAIVELAGRASGSRRGAPQDVGAVFAAARAGDGTARRAVETTSARLAKGLAPVLLVLDPDLMVLGGGISLGGSELLAVVERQLSRLTLTPPRLELSALGADATATGAVRLALTDVERRLLPTMKPQGQRAAAK